MDDTRLVSGQLCVVASRQWAVFIEACLRVGVAARTCWSDICGEKPRHALAATAGSATERPHVRGNSQKLSKRPA
jgi:hypothetical protein